MILSFIVFTRATCRLYVPGRVISSKNETDFVRVVLIVNVRLVIGDICFDYLKLAKTTFQIIDIEAYVGYLASRKVVPGRGATLEIKERKKVF